MFGGSGEEDEVDQVLSLIEVKCPHCGVRGQIILPPVGAIILGPCPHCEELVVVFCGQVLPLDKAIMIESPIEKKRDHLMGVLVEFLENRIDQIIKAPGGAEDAADDLDVSEADLLRPNDVGDNSRDAPTISEDEVAQFVNVDLKLLDNGDYFKAVFDK